MSRLIIASNRLPFTIEKKENEPVIRPSSGGLVSAMQSYFEKTRGNEKQFSERLWVGSVDFSPQDWAQVKQDLSEDSIRVEPVFPDADLYKKYYNGFSNSTLWPLFHYFPSLVQYKKEEFEAYVEVNSIFASKLASIVKKDDVVWIHDYQLMLVPAMLRRTNPSLAIGFFLHTPFPSYEIFRMLPSKWKNEIIHGIMGADLVGFHTHDYVQHFIQSVRMLVGIDNNFTSMHYRKRIVRADLFPIGIDFDKFDKATESKKVHRVRQKIEKSFEGKKILFSVDRLDYTKGLMNRLEGFANFLKEHPEWREKVVYIMNVVPSRDTISTYLERKRNLEELVSTVNGKYSTLQWQPVIYRYNHLKFEELCALYQSADAALVTPLRDGMNLVAKEFVASSGVKNGMLVLSELAGAASELNEALLVNPSDVTELSEAIEQALVMPEQERQQRLQMMRNRLKDYDVVRWVTDFFDQLKKVKDEQHNQSLKLLDEEITTHIIRRYREAKKRCILLDYDGTLTPYARVPREASPGNRVLELLADLSSDKRNEMVIISGRDRDTLDGWLGDLPVNLVAEHGAAIKYQGGDWEQQVAAAPFWKDEVRSIMQLFVTRCVGSLVEEKENTLAWHYRNTQSDLGFIRSRELINTLQQFSNNTWLQVIDGTKVVEVRLTGFDKGVTALKMIGHIEPDFVLCLGNDSTDEDMFKALERSAITIKIGSGGTAAHYTLLTQQEVVPFLRMLASGETVSVDELLRNMEAGV